MESSDERRRQDRFAAAASVYLVGETEDGPFEVHGKLQNLSASGLAVTLRTRLQPGTIVWCAAPAHGLYERGQICHAEGSLLFRWATGIRFLASPPRAE